MNRYLHAIVKCIHSILGLLDRPRSRLVPEGVLRDSRRCAAKVLQRTLTHAATRFWMTQKSKHSMTCPARSLPKSWPTRSAVDIVLTRGGLAVDIAITSCGAEWIELGAVITLLL